MVMKADVTLSFLTHFNESDKSDRNYHGNVFIDSQVNPVYKFAMGPAGQQLGTDLNSLPASLKAIDARVGIIMGNKTLDPWFSLLIPGVDDGKVSVESAKLEEMQNVHMKEL